MVTSGENFSSIGPVLYTKTLVPMKNGFAKKRGQGSREKKSLEHVSLIFRALSLVEISAQSDLPSLSSGKVKKEGGVPLISTSKKNAHENISQQFSFHSSPFSLRSFLLLHIKLDSSMMA